MLESTIIDHTSLVPIGVAVGGILSVVGGAVAVTRRLTRSEVLTEARFGALEKQVQRLEAVLARIETTLSNGAMMRRRDMLEWARLLKARNPTIDVPTDELERHGE